jgi:NAD(P)H-hydrate epimerase
MKISTVVPGTAQLRAHEAHWIKTCHRDWGLVLMEAAGRQAAEQVVSLWQETPGQIIVFCGRGNNGGDGLVVARYLTLWDLPVSVFMAAGKPKAVAERNESTVNYEIAARLGIEIREIDENNLAQADAALMDAEVVVDALLGTGLDRPVEGLLGKLIALINASGKRVMAIDLPSGLNSDTGQIMGCAVQAEETVTFGYLKGGLLHYPGASLCGRLRLVDIGLPRFDELKDSPVEAPQTWLTTAEWLRNQVPERPSDSHKGTFGNLLTVAGSSGMSGASILASKSALRAGCGLSILATPESLVKQLPPQEVIYRKLPETKECTIDSSAVEEVAAMLESFSACVLGPGLTTNDQTVKFVHGLLPRITLPCVIDADGLNAIAADPSVFPKKGANFVLTPHPKELSRLIGQSVGEIQADRRAAALKGAHRFGCTVVLKGAHTVTADHKGRVHINPTGNSAMATAGAGDVLSGIIGGLLAQGMEPFEAAVAGVYIHGAAGDLAAQEVGESGIVASDIMAFVPPFLSHLHNGQYQGSPLELSLSVVAPRAAL